MRGVFRAAPERACIGHRPLVTVSLIGILSSARRSATRATMLMASTPSVISSAPTQASCTQSA